MDRKITKERVNIHLEYDWIKYVIIVIAAVLMWWMIYSSANSIPNQFKIDIMCVDTPVVSDTMVSRVDADRMAMFGEETPIKEINFANQFTGSTGNADFMQIFPLRATTEDLMIAPEQWFVDNPSLLNYLLDFKTIYEPYAAVDGKGNPVTDENGEPIVYEGYWTDEAGRAMLKRLRDWDALYTYHFDRRYWVDYYTEQYKNSVSEAELEERVNETVDGLEELVGRYNLEGQVLGIILNKVPGLENGCFFAYAEDETEDGETVKRNYVLSLFRANLDASTSGGNRGHFNGSKMDKERAESFEFIRFLFSEDANAAGKLNVQRYAAL